MNAANIIIAIKLKEDLRRQIANVDRKVRVYDASELVRAELQQASLSEVSSKKREKLDSLLREAEVILLSTSSLSLLSRSPKLRWVQFTSAGIDNILETGLFESDVIITNARGIHAVSIGEYVLGTILMFAKKAPLCFLNKQRKQWEKFVPFELRGKTLGIIGLGSIGQEIARLAKAFSMRVVATKRSIMKQELSTMGVDKVYPRCDLLEMLGKCDFVVLSVPLTKETTKMLGEQELKSMKSNTYLINISRSGVIDEKMLIRALREGWIAGAGLDVFETEPLPPESELWEMPNVIISPHIAGDNEMYNARVVEIFCENLKRYLIGHPLVNVVDKEKGY